MTTELLIHVILGILLLLIPAGALYWLDRQQLKTFGVAVGRMLVQLSLLCVLMWALTQLNSSWLTLLWYFCVTVYAAFLVLKRCKLEVRRLLLPVSGGMLLGVFLVGLWVLGIGLHVRVFDPLWFVPVMALLMGHTTTMMIRGMNTYLTSLKADEEQYEFLRGNGVTHFKALIPFLRRSLLAVISPTVANLTVLGLTSMPLLLVGLFVGGFTPLYAFVVMLMMVVGCISASVLSLALSIVLYELSQRYIQFPGA